MTWTEIRGHFPRRWLIVEALQARSELGKRRLEKLAVVDAFQDGEAALRAYLTLHRDAPERELYVVHSDHEELDIAERTWLGLRTAGGADSIFALDREPFDYQAWRDKHFEGMSLAEILTGARETSPRPSRS